MGSIYLKSQMLKEAEDAFTRAIKLSTPRLSIPAGNLPWSLKFKIRSRSKVPTLPPPGDRIPFGLWLFRFGHKSLDRPKDCLDILTMFAHLALGAP